jgi:rubredoxin
MAAYRCPGCDYVYDESNGAVREGLWESPAAGTRWDDLPEDWGCPDCAVREKPDFETMRPMTMRAASGTRWGHAPSPLRGWGDPHPLAGASRTIMEVTK